MCSGPQVGNEGHRLKTPYDGAEGDVVRVVRTPWGAYQPVERDAVSWGISVLMPVVPLIGTAVAGAFAVREVRRAQQEARTGAGARSGHDCEPDALGE